MSLLTSSPDDGHMRVKRTGNRPVLERVVPWEQVGEYEEGGVKVRVFREAGFGGGGNPVRSKPPTRSTAK
jgi:hypothetical protein